MAITFSQRDYWDLVHASRCTHQSPAAQSFETIIPCPEQLGEGYYRFINLRDGVELLIGNYQLHDDVVMMMPERSHSLEYGFHFSGKVLEQAVDY
ncbi:MAG: hypothetical protein F6J95_029255 [Leptolyngbya sp. SIO1E4]|nr:hypothetical protein [Leptolyngbya sp. SIO1E4]